MLVLGAFLTVIVPAQRPSAGQAPEAGDVLLRESFAVPGDGRLPAGWSSSNERFLFWPDFVVASDASAHDGRAAIAESISGEAWLQSPPFDAGGCAGLEVRCRLRLSNAADARVFLELSSAVSGPPSADTNRASADVALAHEDTALWSEVSPDPISPRALPCSSRSYAECRIPIALRRRTDLQVVTGARSRAGPAIAVRWRVRSDVVVPPVTVRVDDVLVVGLDDRQWDDRIFAMADTVAP